MQSPLWESISNIKMQIAKHILSVAEGSQCKMQNVFRFSKPRKARSYRKLFIERNLLFEFLYVILLFNF